jgi:hypothetical protein
MYTAFDRLEPVSDRYATLPVSDAFTWDAVLDQVPAGEWYMVAFRSVHRADADEARLTAYDDWAHEEAMHAPGFVHYLKGPTCPDGTCMSFCLWDSRAEARASAGQQNHAAAAAIVHEMYARYELEFLRVRRIDGAGFTFEDYDRAPVAYEAHAPLTFQPGLSPS